MAIFESAILDIDPVAGSDNFDVTVHGIISNFSNGEKGDPAELECDILGDDPILAIAYSLWDRYLSLWKGS
jgi:hypothetical protein